MTYTDKATNQTVFYLLTSMSCIENMDEAKDSMISFSRDDLKESDDLVKVPGEKLFDSTSAPHIKKFVSIHFHCQDVFELDNIMHNSYLCVVCNMQPTCTGHVHCTHYYTIMLKCNVSE